MEEERWLFINDIPLLFRAKSIAKQFEIEFWLNKKPFLTALGLKSQEQIAEEKWRGYIV